MNKREEFEMKLQLMFPDIPPSCPQEVIDEAAKRRMTIKDLWRLSRSCDADGWDTLPKIVKDWSNEVAEKIFDELSKKYHLIKAKKQ